ncbi:MAG: hypothetical protein HGA53_05830, partial [Anaerolineaceae bacterium]|nr:hypothetical protein [Anaerolineaceae bacterium]
MSLKTRLSSILMAFFLTAALLFQVDLAVPVVQAEDELPPPPVRVTNLMISLTEHEWWLVYYENNDIACRIWAEHEGLPNADEVFTSCGEKVYRTWLKTVPCNLNLTNDPRTCRGLYFQKYTSTSIEKTIEVKLPPPVVWVSLEGCNPVPPDNQCSTIPYLHLTSQEPLPNENIIRINGKFNDQAFSCPGGECDVYLPATSARGQTVEFWADSSFGDSSEHYTALVRILPWGNFTAPEGEASDPHLWYADLLSTQWKEGESPTCASSWQVLPDLGGPPTWLRSPEGPEALKTDISYYFLSAMLIRAGMVNADSCPNGGLDSSEVANACGVAAAEPQVIEWQNRFNDELLKVANESGVPAQLLKSVFSRESQFWPGIYKTYFEAGLGQLTEPGAETVLLWNPDFFS